MSAHPEAPPRARRARKAPASRPAAAPPSASPSPSAAASPGASAHDAGGDDDARAARIVVDRSPPRRKLRRRRHNRRITVSQASVTAWIAAAGVALGRRLLTLGKLLAVLGFLALSGLAGRQLIRQVVASPRFAVRDIQLGATAHVTTDELLELAGVAIGDRLLAIDTDKVAAHLTTHPWIAAARVKRDLPSVLAIDVVEREAVGTALLGALYLLDREGRPFKRATFEEADGLPVITGVTREQYGALRPTSEAVFREALAFIDAYDAHAGGSGEAGAEKPARRPRLSEVHVDPRTGFTAVWLDGGGEVRLGRGPWTEKLARLDRILDAVTAGGGGPASLAIVYLDDPATERNTDRVTLRFRVPDPREDSTSKKFRPPDKHGED